MNIKQLSVILIITLTSIGLRAEAYECKKEILFRAGEAGYYSYRIPSLVVSTKGTVLAFAAARKGSGGDWDPIDIVLRRSDDGGDTWDDIQTIVTDGNLPCDNATPIVDRKTGRIHLLYQINYERLFYTFSKDEGRTWSSPKEITSVAEPFRKLYPWVCIAPGPGHGIQLKSGRLIVPTWFSDGGEKYKREGGRPSHRPSLVSVIYSDNYGKTWKQGGVVVNHSDTTVTPSETACVELSDGSVLFSCRNETPRNRRMQVVSKDGISQFSAPRYVSELFEPICMGALCRYNKPSIGVVGVILFSNPNSQNNPWQGKSPTPISAPVRRRENLTVRMSRDNGLTWTNGRVVDADISAYSDLAVGKDGSIFCLYEGGTIAGTNNHYKSAHITIASFPLAWLEAEER